MPVAAGLYYEEHGPAGAPPLILSSGLGGSGQYWQPNLGALSVAHRVILYDHRGTGRSDRALPETTSIAAMADDVIALMDALGIAQADFLGHALGGMIGIELAARYPARLSRLVVVNGWLKLDPHTARCFDVRLDILRSSGAAAFLRAQPLFLFPPEWISAHGERLEAETAAHLAHFPDPATIEKRIAAVRAFDMPSPAIDCGLLVVAALDDMLVPPSASKAVASAVPGASLAVMERGGHACNVTDPDTFNAIVLDFLGS